MTPLNRTATLWSRRLCAASAEDAIPEPGPECCWQICNICCWVAC